MVVPVIIAGAAGLILVAFFTLGWYKVSANWEYLKGYEMAFFALHIDPHPYCQNPSSPLCYGTYGDIPTEPLLYTIWFVPIVASIIFMIMLWVLAARMSPRDVIWGICLILAGVGLIHFIWLYWRMEDRIDIPMNMSYKGRHMLSRGYWLAAIADLTIFLVSFELLLISRTRGFTRKRPRIRFD